MATPCLEPLVEHMYASGPPEDTLEYVHICHDRLMLAFSVPLARWDWADNLSIQQITWGPVQCSKWGKFNIRKGHFGCCYAVLLARNEATCHSQSSHSMLPFPSGKDLECACWCTYFNGIVLGPGQTSWLLTLCIAHALQLLLMPYAWSFIPTHHSTCIPIIKANKLLLYWQCCTSCTTTLAALIWKDRPELSYQEYESSVYSCCSIIPAGVKSHVRLGTMQV